MFMVAAALKGECVTSKQEKKKKSQDHLIKLSNFRFVTAMLCKAARLELASEKKKKKKSCETLEKSLSLSTAAVSEGAIIAATI